MTHHSPVENEDGSASGEQLDSSQYVNPYNSKSEESHSDNDTENYSNSSKENSSANLSHNSIQQKSKTPESHSKNKDINQSDPQSDYDVYSADAENDENELNDIHSGSATNECQELSLNAERNSSLDLSTEIFNFRSIADSILSSINMFRDNYSKPLLQEDERLYNVAMNYSRTIAEGETEHNIDDIKKEIKDFPFAFYSVQVDHNPNENAFTTVINKWTTDSKISKLLLSNFNCAGVGVYTSKTEEVYFTLILALRTNIGNSYYTETSLFSILLAEQCISIVNQIRKEEFGLLPIYLNLDLCDLAYQYARMDMDSITEDDVKEKVGICSFCKISFSDVKEKDATPRLIVQKWMNQLGKAKTILGDCNRVGFGFIKIDGLLHSVSIYTRTLHAAVIDGTEKILGNNIIATQIADTLNEFRQQHSLPPMNVDDDLCERAQSHTEYIANGSIGESPLEDEYYTTVIEPRYEATDISHVHCNEMSRAPKSFMAKWRNNQDCISVLLNQVVDDFGIGVCFDKDYVCHITVIIASKGQQAEIKNIIVKL